LNKKLNGLYIPFSDRINQASLKSFALAGRMDRIEKDESKINLGKPVNPYLSGLHQNLSGRSTFLASLVPACPGLG
jgi:hypothetical protein